VSVVCSKCKRSLTVKESIFKTHQCGHTIPKGAPRITGKTGDYVKSHFTELIAAEMRKTVAS
jgi:ribosomal protein L37AE/L43A